MLDAGKHFAEVSEENVATVIRDKAVVLLALLAREGSLPSTVLLCEFSCKDIISRCDQMASCLPDVNP